ncbi:hypothetical protein F2Q70_00015199 [Brassica cretica]|uniref:Uncharacterized protein n=1 Tax=Brassica cretica TaxID=69181 RepID=A0A8S9I485_BRACR|nr:hypothetical protein F2Q70_00015199 [Brassica cretica]
MISWGPNNNATDEIKSQTEEKIRFEITVAIRTLENPDSRATGKTNCPTNSEKRQNADP